MITINTIINDPKKSILLLSGQIRNWACKFLLKHNANYSTRGHVRYFNSLPKRYCWPSFGKWRAFLSTLHFLLTFAMKYVSILILPNLSLMKSLSPPFLLLTCIRAGIISSYSSNKKCTRFSTTNSKLDLLILENFLTNLFSRKISDQPYRYYWEQNLIISARWDIEDRNNYAIANFSVVTYHTDGSQHRF